MYECSTMHANCCGLEVMDLDNASAVAVFDRSCIVFVQIHPSETKFKINSNVSGFESYDK